MTSEIPDDMLMTSALERISVFIGDIAQVFPDDKELQDITARCKKKLIEADQQAKSIDEDLQDFSRAVTRLESA